MIVMRQGGQRVVQERSTQQRSAIRSLLSQADGFHSAQELHLMLRDRGTKVGLTTVYRALQALVDAGHVDVMRPPSGELLYRRCSSDHHHHLVCRNCGKTVEVVGPAIEDWATSIAAEHGFRDIDHTFEVFGSCPSCATSMS
jgi:Fur family transcriptional regulator, ferric uptake regulator